MASLTDIQTQIAFEIDGNATISSSSSDWGSRIFPINRAITDWGETYDWRQLLKVHNGNVSVAGLATYSLPSNFKRMMGFPKIIYDGVTDQDFPIVQPYRNYEFNSNADRFVNIIGDPNSGQFMVINSPTLASGASVSFTYYASPVSLASTGQITDCPDASFIVQRALYYIYKSREDGRFPEAKVEADRILARMIENENTLGVGYQDRNVQIPGLNRFRIGRD